MVESFGLRRLLVNSFTQSRTLDKNGDAKPYWNSFLERLAQINPDSRILLLGLGAVTSHKRFNERFGLVRIDGVEIGRLMVEFGKKYFYLNLPNLTIHVKDAKDFVTSARYKYDFVAIDIFTGSKVPSFLNSGFLKQTKKLLSDDGQVTANLIVDGSQNKETVLKDFKSVFSNITTKEIGAQEAVNLIIFARD